MASQESGSENNTIHAEVVKWDGRSVVVRVEPSVYGLPSIMKAAHTITDKCFVHLESGPNGGLLCRFVAKAPMTNIEDCAGTFLNAVLDQSLRDRLESQTEPIRRLLLAQAFSNANLLHPELDTANPVDDESGESS